MNKFSIIYREGYKPDVEYTFLSLEGTTVDKDFLWFKLSVVELDFDLPVTEITYNPFKKMKIFHCPDNF
jgi:hypothetical protein